MSQELELPYFHRNCDHPTLDPVDGAVVMGEVPTWLTGTLIRNGPGIKKVGDDTYEYLIDGLAVLHRFHIVNGKVTYCNRPLESDSYKTNMEANRIMIAEFGAIGYVDPCARLFSKSRTMFVHLTKTDNCFVNVGYYGDQLYAMTELNFVRRIDPANLKCIGGKTNITKYVAVNHVSAHPHILADGTALNLGLSYWRKTKGTCYCVIAVPPSYDTDETAFKDSKIIAEIPLRWRFYPSYYHSFGITRDKIIFIEQPYCVRLPYALMRGAFSRFSLAEILRWYPNKSTRIHVISMQDGIIHPVVYKCKNLFTFHHCNAYEEDGHIIVDISAYSNAEVSELFQFVEKEFMNKNVNVTNKVNKAGPRRYVLPLNVSKAKPGMNLVTLKSTTATAHLRSGTKNKVDLEPELLDDQWFELPRINYKYNGLKYRYLYGIASTSNGESYSANYENVVVKLDLEDHVKMTWVEKGVWVAEPVFVQNPTIENPAEDDGVILTNLLYQNDQNKTTLLILDAKDMKEISRIDFKTDGSVPITLHGQWANSMDKVHLY